MRWSLSASCWVCSLVGAVACTRRPPPPAFQVVGESVRLRADEPIPNDSAIFDGTTVKLRGGRGETLGVQLLGTSAQRLTLPPEAATVSGFAVRTLKVKEPSTSMYGESRGQGDYPDPLVPIAAVGEAAGFFDVAILPSAKPGLYAGTLVLADRTLPVVLTVEPVRVEVARQPFVWVFYLPKEIARRHGVADDDGPEQLAWESKYVALFRAHGCFLASDERPARFAARRAFLDGTRYWPVGFDSGSDAAATADVKAWLTLFAGLPQIPFAIPVDEPHTKEARAQVRHLGEIVAQAGGGRPKFLRAVTAPPSPDYDSAVDVYLSPDPFPTQAAARAATGQRFWTYNGRPPQAGSMIVDTDGIALRTWGWIAERYGVELWHAWEGLYWTDRYNRGGTTDVMTQAITFDERKKGGEDFGNGDGVLVYPGPLPSLRLKALRRGLQDRLLVRTLAGCGAQKEADAIVRRLVPRALGEASGQTSWSRDERAWEAARGELYDAIARRCPKEAADGR